MKLQFHLVAILCLTFHRGIKSEKLCPEPKLENARIVCGSHKNNLYYFGDEVSFNCNFGYKTSNLDNLKTHCEEQSDGTFNWTPIPLTCGPIYCGRPENIENGYFVGEAPIVGSEITYLCNIGYYLKGFSKRTCLPDKVWSGWPPVCEIVKCLQPPSIENGEIRSEDHRLPYLSFIHYTCHTGYVLKGSGTRQCNGFGEFTGTEPKCVVSNAPVITFVLEKGELTMDFDGTLNVTEDSKLSLRCWSYQTKGAVTWKLDNHEINFEDIEQKWNSEEYFELKIYRTRSEHEGYFTCTSLDGKTHGINIRVIKAKQESTIQPVSTTIPTDATRIVLTTTNPTAITTFTSDSSSQNSRFRDCPFIGKWDNLTTEIFENGQPMTESKDNFTHTTTLIFRCIKTYGYKLIGSWRRICNNGTWDSDWPFCQSIFTNNSMRGLSVIYRTNGSHYRLDNGDYWTELWIRQYFQCYISNNGQPKMNVNGVDIASVTDKRYSYQHGCSMNFCYIGVIHNQYERYDESYERVMTFTCISNNHSNSITVYMGNKCELNEDFMRTQYNAKVIPSSRRYPIYVLGTVIELECAKPTDDDIPATMTCDREGKWVPSTKRKRCN